MTNQSLMRAQIIQEFFLPYPENHVYNALKSIFPSNSYCNTVGVPDVVSPIRTYISISPTKSGTIIYYDEWEDGYEANLLAPSQSTTKIWGDNNPSNGIPPGFSSDIINSGQTITLQNNINPSNLTFIDYDARDYIATNKPVSITKSHWAKGSETLMAGTLLTYPTSEWGTSFRMPLGTDVNTSIESFSFAGLSVMAQKDNTQVEIDSNNDGVFETSITLNKGEAYAVNGGIKKGATVNSTNPIQVYLITGDICDHYESRWFNILPESNLDNYYFGPLSGTDKLYAIYNPGDKSIKVRGKSSTGALSDITLAANAVTFVQGHPTSGYQFYTNDGSDFVVLALSDASGTTPPDNKGFDWGATLLPEKELTQSVIIGWAPGQDPNFPVTENSAPVWLTVSNPKGFNILNPTIDVCVDYNGDNMGPLTSPSGQKYDVKYVLTPLTSQKLFDPDGNQTNMMAWVCDGSNALISAVYGEDATIASPGSPGLDLGAGVPGINPFYAYKNSTLFTDNNSNGLYNVGDVVEYSIGITNEGFVQIFRPYLIKDILASSVTYVNNSTTITTPTGTSNIADKGQTNFPLDENGHTVLLDLQPNQQAILKFRVTINTVPQGDGCITNKASVGSFGVEYNPESTICVTVSPEICGNNIDDDDDGLVDCEDPDCFAVQASGGQFCLGSTLSLNASGGTSYVWTGPGGFTSSSQNPTRASANFGMSGQYSVVISNATCSVTKSVEATVQDCNPTYTSCIGTSCLGNNLNPTGNFESFDPASPNFTTDMTYFNCGALSSGRYSIVQSAAECNNAWIAAPDHTLQTGTGNYFVANFATTSPGGNTNGNSKSGEIVCFEDLPIEANSTYCFSAQLLNLCTTCTGLPTTLFTVNGITVGSVTGASIQKNAWTENGFSFSSSNFGNPTSLDICLAQGAFGTDGFDLGIDDVQLRKIQSGGTPTATNDVATACDANPITINVLANDAAYVASTLSLASQPPSEAGSAVVSGSSIIFSPTPGFIGTTSFSYTVCGAVSNGCCASANVTVTIAPVTATASGESPICAGTRLSLSATGGNTYTWSGPNGFTANTAYASIPSATIAASGTYTVTVANSTGCSNQETVNITVQNCPSNKDPECNCN